MHAVHCRTIDYHVRSKIPGMSAMLPAVTVILATRSPISTTVSYTSCFMCPQRKKSRHLRPGDLVYETVEETEENLVARITVAAGTISDMPFHLRTDMTVNGPTTYCVHTDQWSRIRAVSVNATPVISMLNYLLCKSSLAS